RVASARSALATCPALVRAAAMADTQDPRATPVPLPRQPATVDLPPADTGPGAAGSPLPGRGATLTGQFRSYEVLGEIQRCVMGTVYRAGELHSGWLVALKMMLQSSDSASSDRQRFILEARATGELNHPGIVAIHSWGEHQGHLFYTMDFVPGVPLS